MLLAVELIPAVERHTGRPGRRMGHNTRLLCPAHDDHHPSLDVAEGPNGEALVYCRSHGCTLRQVAEAVGLGDKLGGDNGAGGDWTPHGEAVAVYRYTDESNVLLYEVCRTLDKQFPLRRPDATSRSGYRWKLEDTRRVVYHLPDVIDAVRRGVRVYVPEGEKDVDRLRREGYVATCNPGGAGNWRDEYSAPLAGATVTVIADRDAAGYQHAARVARSLERVGATVTLRQPAVDQEGADVSDHLNAGLTLDELEPIAAAVPEAEATFTVRSAEAFLGLPEPSASDTLLGPFVRRGSRTIVVGDTGHGKTTLVMQMLAAIVKGTEMLGHTGSGAGPVMVVDLEQGVRSIKRTLREANVGDRSDVLIISAPDGLALDRDEGHTSALQAAIAEHAPTVVVLDPYYKAHRADDPNAERPIIDLMRQLDALRVAHGFALILPAHPRKDPPGRDGARKLTINDVAGSGAVTRGAEVVLGLERLGHGYARLRYLKDRDGDLPVGEAVTMLYSKEEGYRLDPRDTTDESVIEERILATVDSGWLTVREWGTAINVRESKVRPVLEALADQERVWFALGPEGRSAKARCYSTTPEARAQSGAVTATLLDSVTTPLRPTPFRGEGRSPTSGDGSSSTAPESPEEWEDVLG